MYRIEGVLIFNWICKHNPEYVDFGDWTKAEDHHVVSHGTSWKIFDLFKMKYYKMQMKPAGEFSFLYVAALLQLEWW